MKEQPRRAQRKSASAFGFVPFMSLRFRRQRLLAKPADHDLLRLSTAEDVEVHSRKVKSFTTKGMKEQPRRAQRKSASAFGFVPFMSLRFRRQRLLAKPADHDLLRLSTAEDVEVHSRKVKSFTTKGMKEQPRRAQRKSASAFGFVPFMSLRFRRQRLLAKPADHDLLRLSTGEGLAFEVAKFVDDLEPLRAHQQVQFLREEAAHVQIFDTKVWLQFVRSAPAEVPLDAAHLRRIVVVHGVLQHDGALALGIFVLTLGPALFRAARQDRDLGVEHIEDELSTGRQVLAHTAEQVR